MRDGFIVGEVVGYGQVVGDGGGPPRYWVAFRGRSQLPGEYATADEAKAAVEAAL
jgi:hypothetical protein